MWSFFFVVGMGGLRVVLLGLGRGLGGGWGMGDGGWGMAEMRVVCG